MPALIGPAPAAAIRVPPPGLTEGWREILVHVEPTGAGRRRLEIAVDLASRFGAELIGLGAETVDAAPGRMIEAIIGGEVAAAAQALVIDHLCNAETLFLAKTRHIAARWMALQTKPAEALTMMARGADLIVAGGPAHPSDWRSAPVEDVILQAGRPVLVAPSHGRPFRGQAAVVAWNESREARRALADALPLLRRAEVVIVVEACAADHIPEAQTRIGAVAEYLHRHGIEAAARPIVNSGNPADDIKRTAHGVDADLIVCGAFGHSRLRERALGGFTNAMLKSPEHFVLMSH